MWPPITFKHSHQLNSASCKNKKTVKNSFHYKMQKIPIEIQLFLIKIVWMGLANLETSFLNELKIDANKNLWFNNIIWLMLCIMVNDKKRWNHMLISKWPWKENCFKQECLIQDLYDSKNSKRLNFVESTTLMPSDAAQASITSGSTATTATRIEFKLSPKNKLSCQHWLAGEFIIQNNFHFLTIYETLRNKFALGIYILNLLWCYVLTLCQLKYVLFPVMSWQQKFNKIIQISDFIHCHISIKWFPVRRHPKKGIIFLMV